MHYQTSRAERASYSAYFVGQNIFYMLVTGFIALFLMNRGISEAAIAGILLAPKIWDAVNDPIFGIIVDRCHLKGGKFLPWLKLSWVLIPVFTVFLFAMPEHISYGAKVAWAATGYVLWSMSYTVCDAPIFALPTAMTSNVDERTSILSIGRLFATVTSVVITLVVEAVYLSTGWLLLAIVLSAVAMGCMLPILITGRERVKPASEQPATIPQMFKLVLKNRYLLVFLIAYFLIASTMSVEILIPIFAQYVLGSSDAGTILLGICILPMIVIAAIVPRLSRAVDKMRLFLMSLAIYAIASIAQYFAGYDNAVVLYGMTFLRAVGYGGYSILLFLFIPNIMEYGHYTTGERQEGVYFALQTFMTKLTGAVVSSSSMIILAWFGFRSAEADALTGVVSNAAAQGFWNVFTWVSAVGCVLAIPLLISLYKLTDKDAALMSRCNNGEISREDCERQLQEN